MAVLNFSAYGVGRLQDIAALLDQAGEMTVAELRRAIDAHIKRELARHDRHAGKRPPAPAQRSGVSCARCGGRVQLYPVNVSKCTDVGGPWKTQAVCRGCGRDEFSELSAVEIIRRRSI